MERERPGKCKAERERASEATARLEHTAGMQTTANNFFASRLLPPPSCGESVSLRIPPHSQPHTEAGHGIAESVRPSYQISGRRIGTTASPSNPLKKAP